MRILLTNDDGIDSVGLHILARAMREHGDVVIVAPDSEYSGASAAFGAIHLMRPDVKQRQVEGIDEAWAVAGPPALCVLFARLGAFGGPSEKPFDLCVSGINPGANVGRSVYHSGTIGAALTARNGGIHGVAVSQHVDASIEGQGLEELLLKQKWESAAEVASAFVGGLVANPPSEPVLANLNVPNIPVAEMKGWRRTHPAVLPIRAVTGVSLEPKPGHDGAFNVTMDWGEENELPLDSDAGAVIGGYASITWLGRISPIDPLGGEPAEDALTGLLGDT